MMNFPPSHVTNPPSPFLSLFETGRRCDRMYQAGTSFSIDVDFETVEGSCSATISEQDSTKQARIPVDKLVVLLWKGVVGYLVHAGRRGNIGWGWGSRRGGKKGRRRCGAISRAELRIGMEGLLLGEGGVLLRVPLLRREWHSGILGSLRPDRRSILVWWCCCRAQDPVRKKVTWRPRSERDSSCSRCLAPLTQLSHVATST